MIRTPKMILIRQNFLILYLICHFIKCNYFWSKSKTFHFFNFFAKIGFLDHCAPPPNQFRHVGESWFQFSRLFSQTTFKERSSESRLGKTFSSFTHAYFLTQIKMQKQRKSMSKVINRTRSKSYT